jgi:hypothetical protein
VRVSNSLTWGWSGSAAALCVALLAQSAPALASASGSPGEPQNGFLSSQAMPAFALAPGLAPAINNIWLAGPGWGSPLAAPAYHTAVEADAFSDDPASPAFDTSGYDPMWDDARFSEMAAYGGLERDALRIAGMRAIDGSDGVSGAIPYGRLTLRRDFFDGEHEMSFGAYGTQSSVRQAAISGFGEDSYTDVAMDGTWRWTPDAGASHMIAAHLLVLHEGQSLIASHAIFGANKNDELMEFRSDLSCSLSANVIPMVQYFRITGSADPIRLGTQDGSPNSNGFVAGVNYLPSDDARSPLNWLHARLSLEFVAYSEFDGTSHDAAHNNTVLFHLTFGSDS